MKTELELSQDQEHLELKRIVVPIVATSQNLQLFQPIGSAFIIHAAGKLALAITAAHNIREVARIDRPYERCHPTTPLEFRIQETDISFSDTDMRVLYPHVDGKHYLAHLANAYVIESMDIAVCTIVIGEDAPASLVFDKQWVIDSSPPKKGTPILAIGYKEMNVPSHNIEGRSAIVRYSETIVRRNGIITDCYPGGLAREPMSCFQCTTPFDSGMSGGPIVEMTDRGLVAIGVISSDFSIDNLHSGGSGVRALACMLWPAMGVRLKHEKLHEIEGPCLLDFQKLNLITDRGNAAQHTRESPSVRQSSEASRVSPCLWEGSHDTDPRQG